MIVGAGSGIGRAVCQAFAREGARIAAVDLHEKGLAPVLSLPGKIVHSLPISVFLPSFTNVWVTLIMTADAGLMSVVKSQEVDGWNHPACLQGHSWYVYEQKSRDNASIVSSVLYILRYYGNWKGYLPKWTDSGVSWKFWGVSFKSPYQESLQ